MGYAYSVVGMLALKWHSLLTLKASDCKLMLKSTVPSNGMSLDCAVVVVILLPNCRELMMTMSCCCRKGALTDPRALCQEAQGLREWLSSQCWNEMTSYKAHDLAKGSHDIEEPTTKFRTSEDNRLKEQSLCQLKTQIIALKLWQGDREQCKTLLKESRPMLLKSWKSLGV